MLGSNFVPELHETAGLQKTADVVVAPAGCEELLLISCRRQITAPPGLLQPGASDSLEEAGTHIQTVSCDAQERDDEEAAHDGDQIQSEVGLRFGNSLRGNFGDSLHDDLQVGDPRRGRAGAD